MDTRHFKTFNQAADNNKDVIVAELARQFVAPGVVLEIGSGSGQHAVHFTQRLAHLEWQPTEMPQRLGALRENLASVRSPRMRAPLEAVVGDGWPPGDYHYGYVANVIHIMPEAMLPPLITGYATALTAGGVLAIYGPFRYNGAFTTESNARFDSFLREQDPLSGIRDIETVTACASDAGIALVTDIAMPANNQLLIFKRSN